MSRLELETFIHVPHDNWEAAIKDCLAEWVASIPSVCPCHGEPTTSTHSGEPFRRYGDPDGRTSALLRLRFAPCPACRVAKAGVPPLFLRCSFDNFTADTDELRANHAKVRKFAAAPAGFLFLLGLCGTGKTHLAVAALREAGGGIYRRHLEIVEALRESYGQRPRRPDGEDEPGSIADECSDADLLVLDELGVASGGNDAETLLYDILDRRVSRFQPTVICANVEAGQLEGHFGSRLADRFRQAQFAVLNFTGQSRRPAGNRDYLSQAQAALNAREDSKRGRNYS
jgi:DNA replication protein DnaC